MTRSLLLGILVSALLCGAAGAQGLSPPPGAPATGAANTILANPTAGVAAYAATSVPDCDAAGSEALTYTNNTGFGCNTISGGGGGGATLGANSFTATQTVTPAANTQGVLTAGSLTGASTANIGFECNGTINTSAKVLGACLRIAPTMTAAGSDSRIVCFKAITSPAFTPDCAFGVATNNTVVSEGNTFIYATLYVNNTATFNALILPKAYAVAALPACTAPLAGARATVTDATAPTFGVAVAGGGAVDIPVYCDGDSTSWKVG